jgi:hypothetical protein
MSKCEAGCMTFTGGEIRHHKDCVFYQESLTKIHDDLLAEMSKLKEKMSSMVTDQQWNNAEYARLSLVVQLDELSKENAALKTALISIAEAPSHSFKDEHGLWIRDDYKEIAFKALGSDITTVAKLRRKPDADDGSKK